MDCGCTAECSSELVDSSMHPGYRLEVAAVFVFVGEVVEFEAAEFVTVELVTVKVVTVELVTVALEAVDPGAVAAGFATESDLFRCLHRLSRHW